MGKSTRSRTKMDNMERNKNQQHKIDTARQNKILRRARKNSSGSKVQRGHVCNLEIKAKIGGKKARRTMSPKNHEGFLCTNDEIESAEITRFMTTELGATTNLDRITGTASDSSSECSTEPEITTTTVKAMMRKSKSPKSYHAGQYRQLPGSLQKKVQRLSWQAFGTT